MKLLQLSLLVLCCFFGTTVNGQNDPNEIYISVVGDPDLTLCNNDGQDDIIRFRTLPLALATFYMVVDENDIIVRLQNSNFINFEGLPNGTLRVFSVGYRARTILAQEGDNYLEVDLTVGFETISQNFITINNLTPDGGNVSTSGGETDVTLCINADDTVINFATDSDSENYIYLVTDEDNNLLGSSMDGVVDFGGAPAGICRVWGLALLNDFVGEEGQNATEILANNGCADLSNNFVTVTRLTPEGGQLTFADGSESVLSCSVLEPSGTVSFDAIDNSDEVLYTFIIVDNETGLVSDITTTTSIDLATLATGSYTIYGLSYTGNLTVAVGQNFDADNLSDECADLSDNSLSLIKRVQNADDVRLADGSSEVTVCVGDGEADVLTFTSTYMGDDNLLYIITNEGNFVLGTSVDNNIDFENAGTGICRVWTAAYSGNLVLENGDNLGEDPISDECFDLSDGFVLINRNGPDGGTISLTTGDDSILSCVPNDATLVQAIASDNDPNSNYTFLLVNTATNVIVAVLPDGQVDLAGLANGSYALYGFSYVGDLQAQAGDPFDVDALASLCGELSSNSISISREVQEVSPVATANGDTELTICVGDGEADLITFSATATGAGNLVYVVTDDMNMVLGLPPGDQVDFEGAGTGVCRVWALAYTGNLLIDEGTVITADTQISDGCFNLSENFVTVNRNGPDGGDIRWSDDSDTLLSCTPLEPDGTTEAVVSDNDPNSAYTFLLVEDATGNVVAIDEDGAFSLMSLNVGTYTVYGLSYQGDLTIGTGTFFTGEDLSTDCFDLANNVLTLIKRVQHADDVTLEDGSTEVTICVGDGIPDPITFHNNTTSVDNFIYIITNEGNFVLGTSEDNVIDFEGAGAGICRVWGLVYSGELTFEEGDNIGDDAILSSECFDLSDGYVTINRNGPAGGMITFADGSDSFEECDASSGTVLNMTVDGNADNLSYAYIVVNRADNTIAAISTDGTLDLSTIDQGSYDVYGISYLGNIIAMVGDTFGGTALADDCFDLSDNTLSITNRLVTVSGISLQNGNTTASICPNDGEPDILTLNTEGHDGTSNLIYIVTDEDNTILFFSSGASINFDSDGPTIVRVWALAYTGAIAVSDGDIISADTQLSNDCFSLSDNFVLIDRNGPSGGDLSLPDGSTASTICSGDGVDDILNVNTTGIGSDYVYLITDENNIILNITTSAEINFEGVPAGICRIWGLGFGGNLLAGEGDNAAEVELADDCFSLSNNFITVTRIAIDGGSVSLLDGTTTSFACGGDGEADFFEVMHMTSTPETNYRYLVTDSDNNILVVLEGNSIDLELAAPGVCRIWGLAYTGELLAAAGQNAAAATLSDECFALSGNFVSILRNEVIGGSVGFENGGSEVTICPEDGIADVLRFVTTGSSSASYSFAITDTDNNLISYFQGDSLDFDNINLPEEIRIWGVAFSGLRTATSGNIEMTELTDACYDVSTNFVTVRRIGPAGGTVSTTDGATSLVLCTDDGIDDIYTFAAADASNTDYVFLVTDADNTILDILQPGDEINFEGAPPGDCRVWGLAYTGTLLATSGTDAGMAMLSDDCYDLSDNFINVARGSFEAGDITTFFLVNTIATCPVDTTTINIVRENATGDNANFIYLLLDSDNILVEAFTDETYLFTGQTAGSYRIFSYAYGGDFGFMPGDDLSALFSEENCNDISDSFITINNFDAEAGIITANGGLSTVALCVGNNEPDIVNFEVEGASGANYTYVVVDENDIIVGFLDDPSFDFENASAGDWRVFGLSYTGGLQAGPGSMIDDQLAGSCFDLTDAPVFLDKTFVDGGSVFTDDNRTVVYVCLDGVADVTNFLTSSTSSEDYRFILTDQNDVILSLLPGNSFDFETARGLGELRVWGVNYDLPALPVDIGDILTEIEFNEGCVVLSDNFIDIFTGEVGGGSLSLSDGTTSGQLCHGNSRAGLTPVVTTSSNLGYAYLLTDTDNTVISVTDGRESVVNFDDVAPGTYRIWGISYAGSLTISPGDDASMAVASTSCFERSSNFLTIERRESIDAGQVFTTDGEDFVSLCPGDGQADFISFETTSDFPDYRYILTDEDGNILITDIESNSINFDAAPQRVCRLYGVAFTGTFDPPSDGNINIDELSNDCWVLSGNFITLVKLVPDGGTVATADGETEIQVTVGDGEDDIVQFTNTGITPTPYAYVITDEDNVIIGTSANGEVNFEGAGEGICRVWGLSYTGNIIVGQGDDADEVALTDDCFDLSDNFVTVTRNGMQGDANEDDWTEQLQPVGSSIVLRPNPVVDQLRLDATIRNGEAIPTQRVEIFDLNGRLVSQLVMSGSAVQSSATIDVSTLQAGIYLVRWQNGTEVIVSRFIKQDY